MDQVVQEFRVNEVFRVFILFIPTHDISSYINKKNRTEGLVSNDKYSFAQSDLWEQLLREPVLWGRQGAGGDLKPWSFLYKNHY